MQYDRQALINARAHDLASDGGFQYEVAEDGLRAIDSMCDNELKEQCAYYGIDCNE
jgi:hypothetical protein